MKYLLLLLLLSGCAATDDIKIKVGAGLKLSEADIRWDDGSANHPISARIEIYKKHNSIYYGVSHRSQWFVGKPFNNNGEYHVTELFVDYEFK